MTDYITTIPAQVEYRVERPSLSEDMRRLYEHLRRQAIEDIRKYDTELYGRNDHTIPLKRQ